LAFDPGWADNSFFYLSFTVNLGADVGFKRVVVNRHTFAEHLDEKHC